jgi:hypothetical protein
MADTWRLTASQARTIGKPQFAGGRALSSWQVRRNLRSSHAGLPALLAQLAADLEHSHSYGLHWEHPLCMARSP